jgi:hypothetical protein
MWNLDNVGYLALKILASVVTSMLLIVCYLLLFTQQRALKN